MRADEITAQAPQQKVKAEHGQCTGGQHPQGLQRLIGHHTVVDVHDEQRRHQREQIDQGRRDKNIAIYAPGGENRLPKPIALRRHGRLWRTCIVSVAQADENGISAIVGTQVARGYLLLAIGVVGRLDARLPRMQRFQQHTRAPLRQQ